MRYYPLVMVLFNLSASVNCLYQAATFGDLEMALMVPHVLSSSLQGFVNAFVYGATPAVR